MDINSNNAIRRNDLDWLRVFAVLSVFLYHSVHFFDFGDWSVKNPTTYSWIEPTLMNFMAVWMMPLIFLISGSSVFYAVSKTNVIEFIQDKVMRLFIPLVVGVFSFSVMQVYFERITHNQFQGSFFKFIPHYFDGVYVPGGAGNFAFHGMHLWYLLVLFIFSFSFIPLFWWFKSTTGSAFLGRIGKVLAIPGFLVLLSAPTIIIQNVASSGSIVIGGWQLKQYAWFFFAGYLISSSQDLQIQIIKTRWLWACLSVVFISVSVFMFKGPANHPDVLVWIELFTILGLALKQLNFSNRLLESTREAVMPFYIQHQNVLFLIGFFVVNLSIPDLVKYLIIVISTLVVIIVLYVYIIRRNNFIRILFGMKKVKKDKKTETAIKILANNVR
jgi:peptidoglycan/LPS O-acetylase OafA/YrhL